LKYENINLATSPEGRELANYDFSTLVKKKPWIDKSSLKEINFSPLINTGGIRQTTMPKAQTKQATLPEENIKKQEEKKEVIMCGCGQPCNLKSETQCSDCLAKLDVGTQFGYLYEKEEDGNLWRYWFKLLGNQLYRIQLIIIY